MATGWGGRKTEEEEEEDGGGSILSSFGFSSVSLRCWKEKEFDEDGRGDGAREVEMNFSVCCWSLGGREGGTSSSQFGDRPLTFNLHSTSPSLLSSPPPPPHPHLHTRWLLLSSRRPRRNPTFGSSRRRTTSRKPRTRIQHRQLKEEHPTPTCLSRTALLQP